MNELGFRTWGARLATAALFLLAACEGQPTIEARPALWRVRDADTTIWLLGTVHALPPRIDWRTPAIERAVAAADVLVIEIAQANPRATRDAFSDVALAEGLPPIRDRVAPASRTALQAALERTGLGTDALDGLKTWAAALTIGAALVAAEGGTAASGVEAVLADDFAAARKPVRALETAAEQFALFDALPEPTQRALLGRTIADPAGYRATIAAWGAGDTARLAAAIKPGLAGLPEVETALVTRRNARWSRWAATRMGPPGEVLVAVGAGHLVGNGSVLAMLEAKGFRVERVQ